MFVLQKEKGERMAEKTNATITAVEDGQDPKEQEKEKGNPVIVVPGMMGSRLFTSSTVFDNSTRVWEPVVDLSKANIERALMTGVYLEEDNLYVRPFEKQSYDNIENAEGTVKTYGREYGAINAYDVLVKRLCDDLGDERDVYFFSYDWRNSNTESAEQLNTAIKGLGKQVDLVCHSNGGLVASKYFQMYKSQNKVDKIITCATPYEGAPKLINSIVNFDVLAEGWLEGADFEGDFQDLFLALAGVTKQVKVGFQGVAELTPTKNYITELPMQKIIYQYEGGYDRAVQAMKDLTYEEYVKLCEDILNQGTEGKYTYGEVQNFQTSLLAGNGYNLLLEYENAFFVIGINQKTITGLVFNNISSDVNRVLYETDLQYEILGDGTVPYLSASITKQVPNSDPDKKRSITFASTHMDIVKLDDTISWIMDILRKGYSKVEGNDIIKKEYIVARTACPVDMTVIHNGELVTSQVGQTVPTASFGRLDLIGINKEIKMVCIDAGDDYEIVLKGTGKGVMDYSIRFFNERGILFDESNFTNVPITENTIIHTGTNRKSGIVLNIDSNGDGRINEIYTSADHRYKNEINDYQLMDEHSANIDMEKTSGKSMVLPVMAKKESFDIQGAGGHSRSGENNEILPEKKVLYERLVAALIQRKRACENR